MASRGTRGRKKRPQQTQKNTLLSYVACGENPQELCCKIVDQLVDDVSRLPEKIASDILDEVLTKVCSKTKKHDASSVSDKTMTEWSKKYPWLIINETKTKMTCSTCQQMQRKQKLTSVWANEGTSNIQFSAVTRHNSSTEHEKACSVLEKQTICVDLDIEEPFDKNEGVVVESKDKKVFNTIYYAAKSELASNTVNGLIKLQVKNGVDMGYSNLSPTSVSEMQSAIAHVLRQDIIDAVKASDVFGLILDESTDVTVDRRLSICLRYVKNGKPATQLLCNVPIPDGCAHTIVNCVAAECEKYGLPLIHCTFLATDGAAAMLGRHMGVGQQMIRKYSPFCIQIHCLAHRLNLACTDCIKKNDYMLKFKEKFGSLYLFISGSSIRTLALRNIQALLEEPEITIKEPYSIRWLGLRNAVLAVFECYGSVITTLSKFAAEKNATAKGLLKYFCSYKVALVVAMILDIHNELAVLSCALQKQNLLFSEVKPLMDATVCKITSLETRDGECLVKMKAQITKRDDGVFLGDEKLSYHEGVEKEFENIRQDYIKRLKKNISNRFKKEDSAVFDDFSKLFEPETTNTCSEKECKEALQSLSALYGHDKSTKIIHGNLTDGPDLEEEVREVGALVDPEKLIEEWPRLYGMIKGAYATYSTTKLCKRLIMLHSDMMPNIAKLATIALCLQPTSVECERSFSTQNRLKTKQRASLGSESLNTLITISMLGPSVQDFDPSAAIVHWYKQRKRRKGRLYADYQPRPAKRKRAEETDSDSN